MRESKATNTIEDVPGRFFIAADHLTWCIDNPGQMLLCLLSIYWFACVLDIGLHIPRSATHIFLFLSQGPTYSGSSDILTLYSIPALGHLWLPCNSFHRWASAWIDGVVLLPSVPRFLISQLRAILGAFHTFLKHGLQVYTRICSLFAVFDWWEIGNYI